MNNDVLARIKSNKNGWIFLAFWMLTFVIYIPAGRSGWVIDATGWIYDMKHNSFWNFINRKQSGSQSFYQLFALHYFIFYKLWKLNVWMWSILYISVHAINAFLFYIFCCNLLNDTAIKNSRSIVLGGTVLFIICPHVSEVIVWKACSHYLQGYLFILLSLLFVQKYQHVQKTGYIVASAVIFALSVFGLEIFYLIPFFVLTTAFFYRFAINVDKKIFRKTIRYFFIPQLILLCVYFIALYAVYRFFRPHKTDINESITSYLAKPLKYLFHIIFLGRYFSIEAKNKVYAFCQSVPCLIVFYSVVSITFAWGLYRFKKIDGGSRVMLLLFAWVMMTLFFLFPLYFADADLLVFYDRYTYFTCGFVYILLAMITARLTRNRYVIIALFCIYFDINLFFTIEVNTDWIKSTVIDNKLLHDIPLNGNKTVLLLNIPENMNGVPMIGAQPEGAFKTMKEIFTDSVINNTVYDVASYNMNADYNGAHVTVLNDSVMKVVLNHGGTWWWYEGHGAKSYETPDYKMIVKPVGMEYDLVLKHSADKYQILYSVGDQWKTVNMDLKNKQQD